MRIKNGITDLIHSVYNEHIELYCKLLLFIFKVAKLEDNFDVFFI